MDQIKIGKFIGELRKEKKLTQKELAEKLLISDKTVSKWERGKGLPDVSLMMPLCEILDITVNELLSAQYLSDLEYKTKSEEIIMNLIKEKQESKYKIILSVIVFLISFASFTTIVLLIDYYNIKGVLGIFLIILSIIILFAGIGVAAALDMKAGTFECPACKTRFVPNAIDYLKGPHTLLRRKLVCPNCGKKSYCKRKLTH